MSKINFTNIIILIITTYLSLATTDWLLKKYSFRFLNEASKIKYKKYEESKKDKIKAYSEGFKFTVYPGTLEQSKYKNILDKDYLPLASYPNSKTFLCDEGYGLIKYTTDKFGFRNNNKVYDKPIDIILIGDSFVHGSCVEEKFSIAGILNKNFNVLNLGIGSTNPTHYALNIKIFSKYFKSKNIIIIFYSNDYEYYEKSPYQFLLNKTPEYFDKDTFINNQPIRYNKKVIKMLDIIKKKISYKVENELENQILTNKEKEGNSQLKQKYKTLKYHFKLMEIRKKILTIVGGNKKTVYPNTIQAIKILEKFCNPKNNCKPNVVFIPSSDYWDYDYRGKVYYKFLKKYLDKKNNIKFIDLSNKIIEKDHYAPEGIHLSIKGYEIVSKKIEEKIN